MANEQSAAKQAWGGITQENRIASIETPLGKDVLLITRLRGIEAISTPFNFHLDLISENHQIKFEEIIGKNITISVNLADESQRFLNGIISHFSQKSTRDTAGEADRFSFYTGQMVPWLWLLTETINSTIFQNLTIPQIVGEVFAKNGLTDFRESLKGSYQKREYCVQYRETDFNFISRLMEEEGIYYFFEHEDGKHTLVMSDMPDYHRYYAKRETARFHASSSGFSDEDVINRLEMAQEIRPGKYILNDYNFMVPDTNLKVEALSTHDLGPGKREIYDYPGLYTKRDRGEKLASVRMEEEEARITTLDGSSDYRDFASGYRFTLIDFSRAEMNDKDYVITFVEHTIKQEGAFLSSASEKEKSSPTYSNNFKCIPFDVPFRPPRIAEKPVVNGAQTAIVVGPSSEEIFTDQYGRVKVHFHWDRLGQMDETGSCWIRVSQAWSGAGWGAMHIPRIGHEVIVNFEEGDPDRPIITGSVYHGANSPPYKLPGAKTKSTLKTMSTPNGEGFNEIRFEDKADMEQIFVNGQMDVDVRVGKDSRTWVGNDSHIIVKKDKVEKVEADKHLIVMGDHNEKVDGTISIQAGADLQEKVGGKHALDVGDEIHLKAGMKIVLESGTSITIKAGANFIEIGPGGIDIKGTMINLNSGGSAGSGSGSSPEDPIEPMEADAGGPGAVADSQDTAAAASEPSETQTAATSPQANTFKEASKSGTPFCDT